MPSILNTPSNIYLTSGQDTETNYKIHRSEVTKSCRTIGSYQTLTGCMEKEIKIKENAITNWGSALQINTIYINPIYKA